MSKLLLVWSCGLVLVLDVRLASFADAFPVVPTVPTLSSISLSKSSQLFMGKGFHGAKQKQAEMMRKMQLAKQQKQEQQQEQPQQKDTEPGDTVSTTTEERISSSSSDPDKTKEFEALLAANLAKQPASVLPSTRERRALPPEVDFWKTPKSDSLQQLSSSSIPATNKVKARRKKQRKQKQQAAAAAAAAATEGNQSYSLPIGVGQKAHRHDFDALLSATTRQPMGPMTASQLVPWVPPYLQEALVVVVDPRRRSGDWRLAVQQLLLLPPPTGDRGSGGEDGNGRSRVGVCAISADPVDETASWLTRMIQDNGSDTTTDDRRPAQPPPSPRVFCDPQLEWMTRYSVVATATAVPASTSGQTMMDDSQDTAAIMDVPASSSSSSSSVASYRWSIGVLVFDSDGILTELYRGLEDASQTCRQVNEILDRFE